MFIYSNLHILAQELERYSDLSFFDKQESDAGNYTCQAANVAGVKEETFSLEVLGM